MIVLLLGGARSGKSALAERRVLAHPGPVTYLATGRAIDHDGETDDDLAARIAVHRHRRDPRFTTVEAGPDLTSALRDAPRRPTLVDALGTWVAAHRDFDSPGFGAEIDAFIDQLQGWPTDLPLVIVSDEVGLGVHPETEVGRRFRDVLGTLNQHVAAVADETVLVVAGRVLRLDPADSWAAP